MGFGVSSAGAFSYLRDELDGGWRKKKDQFDIQGNGKLAFPLILQGEEADSIKGSAPFFQ